MKDIMDYVRGRYAAKHYDESKPISAENMAKLKEILRLAPSSLNIQSWHFIIVSTADGKAKLVNSVQGLYEYNIHKILEAPHIIIFCARTNIDAAYVKRIIDKEKSDGHIKDEKIAEENYKMRLYFIETIARAGNMEAWAANQVYINLGAFLLGVAGLGLDATPMTGFDRARVSESFGLKEKSLFPVCLVSIGYHSARDNNISRPKSRLDESGLFTEA